MSVAISPAPARHGLEHHGLTNVGTVYWNLPTPRLYEEAVRRREGRIAHLGPLVVRTGQHTGRSPTTASSCGSLRARRRSGGARSTGRSSQRVFESLRDRMLAYLQGRDLFVQDCFVGADERYRMPVRIITAEAWHSLFAHTMFIQATLEELADFVPEFTVIQAPGFHAIPEVDGTRSEVFIVLNFGERTVLIGGTEYAGEIKKSHLYRHELPAAAARRALDALLGQRRQRRPERCRGLLRSLRHRQNHSLGRPGADLDRRRRARVERPRRLQLRRRLLREGDPPLAARPNRRSTKRRANSVRSWRTSGMTADRAARSGRRLADREHARGLPDLHIPNALRHGVAGHPAHNCDADRRRVRRDAADCEADAGAGDVPLPLRLHGQSRRHRTRCDRAERNLQHLFRRALHGAAADGLRELLGDRIARHGADVWLVNTGWTAGPYGTGHRMPIAQTRALLTAALSGDLRTLRCGPTRRSGSRCQPPARACLRISSILAEHGPIAAAYDAQAARLAGMFAENFTIFSDQVPAGVKAAGPVIG